MEELQDNKRPGRTFLDGYAVGSCVDLTLTKVSISNAVSKSQKLRYKIVCQDQILETVSSEVRNNCKP